MTSPADGMLSEAIRETLAARPEERRALFETRVMEIAAYMAAHPAERPWTCTVYDGTDGSRIFRGGVGHSLVIDTAGRLWRARSHEDFETTWIIDERTATIDTLTPIYATMREYVAR